MNNKIFTLKKKPSAFTLVELLVVIAVIALLITLLVPAVGKVRIQAKIAAQKTALNAITLGLDMFRKDWGTYPKSEIALALKIYPTSGGMGARHTDVGAHHLAEAMFGLDLLGYQEDNWYEVSAKRGVPIVRNDNGQPIPTKRADPYVSIESIKIGRMTDDGAQPRNFSPSVSARAAWLNENRVIMDVFNASKPRPVLYFRAHTNERLIHNIYRYEDNEYIIGPGTFDMVSDITTYLDPDDPSTHPKYWNEDGNEVTQPLKNFEYYLWDQRTGVTTKPPTAAGYRADKFASGAARPYKRDSFILMTAGPDGDYGTEDDVCNFQRTD